MFKTRRSSARPSEARLRRAKRGRPPKAAAPPLAERSEALPPSLARASNKSTDASLLAATKHVASKHLSSAGKRALHERDFYSACESLVSTLKLLHEQLKS